MNALNRDLKYMERVVIKAKHMSPKYQALPQRVFVVEGGYGMLAEVDNCRIFGTLEFDGRQIDIFGDQIDAAETESLQAGEE